MEDIGLPEDNCPAAPPSQVTVRTRVLHRACQMLGGVEPLAALLGDPPTPVFLQAVDIVSHSGDQR